MARKRRLIEHGALYMISFRTETGLPFVPSPLCVFLLEGIVAKAQELYGVTICHQLWMANHPHIMLVTKDPHALPNFIGYIKTESAHMINALLGRRQRSVWTRGYNLLKIAGPEKAKQQIAYLYNNPTKADLVESIESYPGLNSWNHFVSGTTQEEQVTKTPRCSIPRLATPSISISEAKRQVHLLESEHSYKCKLVTEPNAWLNCFQSTADEDPEKIRDEITQLVRAHEKSYSKIRATKNKEVIGATSLQRQSILVEYEPKKFGPGLLIIADDPVILKDFLSRYFELCERAKEVYKKWKEGILLPMPPGMIPPRRPSNCCYWHGLQI